MTKTMKAAIELRNKGHAKYDTALTAEAGGVDTFRVKSQSGGGYYRVTIRPKACECPAWMNQDAPRRACKHIEAARLQWGYLNKAEPDQPDQRRNYPNAPWYEAVARREYRAVREMLRCLGAQFPYERGPGRGRPPTCYGDLLVVGGLARYHDDSSRYALPDPEMLVAGGYLQRPYPPQASTLRDHMRTEAMRAMLVAAFNTTAGTVRNLETHFVMDSTHLHTPNSELTFEKRGINGSVRFKSKNVKLNIAAGLRTHVMTGLIVMGEHQSDQTAFIPTLEQFWDRFRIDVVYADAGYDDGEHFEAVAARGGVAMIDFRNPGGKGPQGLPHYDAQLARYQADPAEYLENYHVRSLAETVNSTFMRTIANGLRSRYSECLVAEAWLLCIVYNLIRLLHARAEFAIDIPWLDARALRVVDGLNLEQPAA